MADLMEATGLEKGGIYRHFSTKEELAAEAFDYAWQAATDVGMHGLDSIPNSVDKLKRFISNFIDRRPSVPGGCPLLNTASMPMTATPSCVSVPAKPCINGRICFRRSSGRESNGRRSETRADPKKLVTLIVGSREGALMISRLESDREALLETQSHLERYLDSEVRLRPRARN